MTINDPLRYNSYQEFVAQSRATQIRHTARTAGRLPVRLLQIAQDAHEDEDPATGELLIGLVTGGSASARWSWGARGRWNETAARRPGDIGVSPARTSGFFQVDGPSRMLIVGVEVDALKRVLSPGASLEFGRLHDQYAQLPQAQRLCRQMWKAAAHPSAVSDDYIEASLVALIDVLEDNANPATEEKKCGLLTPKQLALLDEIVNAAGPTEATVQDLARALDLPLKTFRMQFRSTTGFHPYAFLQQHRLELARYALETTSRSIADIALEMGFANQAHLTMAFARHTGLAPGQYRKASRT